jgi:hypothetical protein
MPQGSFPLSVRRKFLLTKLSHDGKNQLKRKQAPVHGNICSRMLQTAASSSDSFSGRCDTGGQVMAEKRNNDREFKALWM